MTVNVRSGSAWEQAIPLRREGAAWTGEGDAWYIFNESLQKLIHPDGTDGLEPPENVSVGTIGDHEGTATWTNPAQATTPTHHQVRIPEITSVWTELAYPDTSFLRSGLAAATDYQFQIRNVVRTLGVISHTSVPVSAFFTTLALDGPGAPAKDPGGTGPDTTLPWSDPGGGGPVGGGGCWWEYEWQSLDITFASYPDLWLDTGITGSVAGDIGDWDFDPVADGLTCGTSLRLKYNKNCNSVPEADQFGDAMVIPCDWDQACADLPANTALLGAPYTDAEFAFPVFCYVDDEFIIEDANGPSEYGKLEGFGAVSITSQAVYGAAGLTTDSAGIVGGRNSAVAAIAEGSDLAFSGSSRLYGAPTIKSRLLVVGQTVEVYAYPSGAGYKIAAQWPTASGLVTLVDDTVRTLGVYVSWSVNIDQDGTKELWVNGVQVDTDTAGVAVDMSSWNGDVICYGNEFLALKEMAGWSRVLTPSELGGLTSIFTYHTDTWEMEHVDVQGQKFTFGEIDDYFMIGAAGMDGAGVFMLRGGSGRNGSFGGEVDATRALPQGEKIWVTIGKSTRHTVASGGHPNGGYGRSGTAFTQAGGGGGMSSFIIGDHWAGASPDPLMVAGGSSGDPNGSGSGLDGGGFAGTESAEDPNPGRGAIVSAGGLSPTTPSAQDGTFLQGADSDLSSDASGGGGGYYGGAGGVSGAIGGGGSSFADAECSAVTFSLAAASGDYGRVEMTADLAIPPAAAVQVAAGAVMCFPLFDPFGFEHKNIVDATDHAIQTWTTYPGIGTGPDYLGPDGLYYPSRPSASPGTPANYDRIAGAVGTGHTVPASASAPHAGYGQEFFICRTGARPLTYDQYMCGWANVSTSAAIYSGIKVDMTDDNDKMYFGNVQSTPTDILNTTDVWHHVYLRLEGDNSVSIYLDGVLDTTGTYAGTFGGSFYPAAGPQFRVSDAGCRPFNVAVANVAVYDTDIYTAQHVSDVMTAFGI